MYVVFRPSLGGWPNALSTNSPLIVVQKSLFTAPHERSAAVGWDAVLSVQPTSANAVSTPGARGAGSSVGGAGGSAGAGAAAHREGVMTYESLYASGSTNGRDTWLHAAEVVHWHRDEVTGKELLYVADAGNHRIVRRQSYSKGIQIQ